MYYFCSFIQVKKTKKFNIKNKINAKTNQKTFNRYLTVLHSHAFVELLY